MASLQLATPRAPPPSSPSIAANRRLGIDINEDDDVDGSEYAVVAGFNRCWFFADDWIWDFRFNRFDSLLCGLLLQCQSPLSVNLFTGERAVLWSAGFREMGDDGPMVSKDDGGGDRRLG
ncbi:hypothetical protein L1987_23157 [Smallanthus sonchifolius]|uniref:Uncharacterized protein n=1 Tax=Smallanthus sonchifolius TaxID=185202 RepID=A0ACB9IGN4_9ASTR|nr:hypothetical protein L1987_23157 [Smallanthus sonchifolius]